MLGFNSGFVLAGAQGDRMAEQPPCPVSLPVPCVCCARAGAQGDRMAWDRPVSLPVPLCPLSVPQRCSSHVQSLEIFPLCALLLGDTSPGHTRSPSSAGSVPPSPASGAQLVPHLMLPQQFCPNILMWFDRKSTDPVIRSIPLVIFLTSGSLL